MRLSFLCWTTLVGLLCVSTAALADDAKPQTLRVASLSIFPEKWDKAGNADKIEKMVRDAARQQAKFIITPEGVLEGYLINVVNEEQDAAKKADLTKKFREIAEPIDGPYIQRFLKLTDELDVHLVLGFLERDGEYLFNTAALLGPDGKLVGRYHKTHFAQGYDINPPGYIPGDTYPVFPAGDITVGMMICFDRQPPEPARSLALAGADLIACPSYGSKGPWNTRLMQVRAYENQTFVVFTHPEQSLIIDRNGELLDETGKDSIAIQEIDIAKVKKRRITLTKRRPETYDPIRDAQGTGDASGK